MHARRPWSTLTLAAAIALVLGQLWFADDNMPQVLKLSQQIALQKAANTTAQQRNARAIADLEDLREGRELIEERARADLGLVKKDELLFLYAGRGPSTAPPR